MDVVQNNLSNPRWVLLHNVFIEMESNRLEQEDAVKLPGKTYTHIKLFHPLDSSQGQHSPSMFLPGSLEMCQRPFKTALRDQEHLHYVCDMSWCIAVIMNHRDDNHVPVINSPGYLLPMTGFSTTYTNGHLIRTVIWTRFGNLCSFTTPCLPEPYCAGSGISPSHCPFPARFHQLWWWQDE